MAKIDTFRKEYYVNRQYKMDAQALLSIPAWELIEKSDMIKIIEDFLKKEKVPFKKVTTINGIPEVDVDGYTVEAVPTRNYAGSEFLKVKLYRNYTKYTIEEEVELPF